jgi:hypothetical protein
MTRLVLMVSGLLMLAQSAWAVSSGEEIKAALVGNTFQGGMGGGAYSSYFAPDGIYHDKDGKGDYSITDLGVCYPNTNFGCYQATIKGDQLEWFQDGKSQGTGTILKGNPLKF